MLDVGASEILVVLLVTQFAFGPDKLPEAARRGDQVMTDLRSWSGAARREVSKALAVPADEAAVPMYLSDELALVVGRLARR